MGSSARCDAADHVPPLLRWAGGKQNLIRRLLPFVPSHFRQCVYREPFLGAASMFFALRPHRAVLADMNEHLVNCYDYVRDHFDKVAAYLQTHIRLDSKGHYYKVRDQYNRSRPSAAQAARFIYLNRTCFNGIFRVNEKGLFNVPYAYKDNPIFPDNDHLARASRALACAEILVDDYEDSLAAARRGDFLYLDPPYPPLNGTSFFTHYTKDRFDSDDQEHLADLVVCHLSAEPQMLASQRDQRVAIRPI